MVIGPGIGKGCGNAAEESRSSAQPMLPRIEVRPASACGRGGGFIRLVDRTICPRPRGIEEIAFNANSDGRG